MKNELTLTRPNRAVALRRELLKDGAVLQGLEPTEVAVFYASTARTVAELSTQELMESLRDILPWLARDIGYRIAGENDMKYLTVRTCELLQRYYSGLSLKDFRLAFEMVLTGELDEYLPKGRDGQADRGHYQQFNAEYVCKILNAYKGRRAAVLRRALEAAPEREREEIDEESKKEYRNKSRKYCIDAFEYFKEHDNLPEMSPIVQMLNYETLADVGLVEKIEITPEIQKIVWRRTVGEYMRRAMFADVSRMEKEGTDAKDIEYGSFALARYKALERAFAKMVDEGIEITDYIKFE